MYQIEKDVPMPRRGKYPFSEMEIGDSFSVPAEDRLRLASSASRASARLGCKFVTRKQKDGSVRCWRTA